MKLKNNEKLILCVNWSDSYEVKYNSGTGSGGTMPNSKIKIDGETQISANAFIREGYHFGGWGVQRESDKKWWAVDVKTDELTWNTSNPSYNYKMLSDNAILDNATFFDMVSLKDDDAILLYAQWVPNTYTVQYLVSATGGSTIENGHMAPTVANYGMKNPVNKNKFIKTGYHFGGWKVTKTANHTYLYENSDKCEYRWYQADVQPNGYNYKIYPDNFRIDDTMIDILNTVNGNVGTWFTLEAVWIPN
jgi:hypothetical protein